MGDCGKPQNLDDFAAVSRRMSRAGPRNMAKFSTENWALIICDITQAVEIQL